VLYTLYAKEFVFFLKKYICFIVEKIQILQFVYNKKKKKKKKKNKIKEFNKKKNINKNYKFFFLK